MTREEAIKIVRNIYQTDKEEEALEILISELHEEKIRKELEHWNSVGPTVQEFLYGKQPGVDLEKEIHEKALQLHTAPCYEELEKFARHFYELGLNSRKEE